jgi:nucleoid-associated protein YgaU
MEPAMAVCAGIATATLTLGVIGSLPGAARRLGAVEIPMPVRPIAAILMLASVIAAPVRSRPASATVAPPIVRLADAADVDDGAQPAPSNAASPAIAPVDRTNATYIVEPGDCLWRIARDVLATRGVTEPSGADVARLWPAIYEANRSVIGDDPNLIHPGQSLEIPEM